MAAGKKTGGRKKGTPNRATAAKAEAIEASGLTPLDYMLAVLRDAATLPHVRLDAAKAAAPYVHSRFSAIDPGRGEQDDHVPVAERLKAYAREAAIEGSGGKVVEIKRKGIA